MGFIKYDFQITEFLFLSPERQMDPCSRLKVRRLDLISFFHDHKIKKRKQVNNEVLVTMYQYMLVINKKMIPLSVGIAKEILST